MENFNDVISQGFDNIISQTEILVYFDARNETFQLFSSDGVELLATGNHPKLIEDILSVKNHKLIDTFYCKIDKYLSGEFSGLKYPFFNLPSCLFPNSYVQKWIINQNL